MKIEQLHSLFLECGAVSTDTRKIKNNDLFFALKGENFNGNSYATKALKTGAKFAVIDEKEYQIPDKTILVENALETLQALARFHRIYLKLPIIALTGSNGKTTTKELINCVLSQNFKTTATLGNLNNHIGVPLTLLSMNQNTEIGIVEMGANHQKEIDFLCNIAKPDFGYITNFGKAHLEGFGSVEGVIKGKSEMYNYLIANNKTVFVNSNDKIQINKTEYAKRFTFGTKNTDADINFIEAQPFVISKFEDSIITSQLIGDYNFNNIAAAIAIGKYFKVDTISIKSAIESYRPTNNRSQIIEKASNKIILDAYNANPTSMRAALLNLEKQEGHKTAILGDMFELGSEAISEHQTIADLAISLNIQSIILVGENFFTTITKSERLKKYNSYSNLEETVNISEIKDSTILIKGSRGMALERILN
ncbi:UDP-N-acetylmuramoyl-tripeptide--D-alanyl-D-alanine ligase [Algibacter sp. Ld11]|uniref:UDP-N-acetylmuramoyl-tripeptide--D-alanyl-D- alanine ligase n=1 Tax=Algibacter sp. Ld11 TaxID=649150 RepID=UPI003869CFE4